LAEPKGIIVLQILS